VPAFLGFADAVFEQSVLGDQLGDLGDAEDVARRALEVGLALVVERDDSQAVMQ